MSKITNFLYALKYRFIDRWYLVDSGLDKYEFHERDDLMLHANFTILKDFVEKDLSLYVLSCKGIVLPFRYTIGYRNSRDGLEQITYMLEECCKDHWSSTLIEKYEELYALYDWWINKRPTRVDPYEVSYSDLDSKENYDAYISRAVILENTYNDEDQSMLIRLINIRKYLWI